MDVPAEGCFVGADVSQFEIALVNLAVNTRDAIHGESRLLIEVRCGRSLPEIRGHGGSGGRFITIAVRDNGCGIAKDRLPRIF